MNRGNLGFLVFCGFLTIPAAASMYFLWKQQEVRKSRLGKKAAVVLSGCGYLDGSETTEVSAVLVTLAQCKMPVTVFAPEGNSTSVVDHQVAVTRAYVPRNMMEESARLTRGGVKPLSELSAKDFDCLFIPGGFGVAKNLSNWATASSPESCVIDENLKKALKEFNEQKKPIGLCCISPVLAAVLFPGVKLTVGRKEPKELWPYGGTVGQVESLGAEHIPCDVSDVIVDDKRKIVTTPAFMCATDKGSVFSGVQKMVYKVTELL